MTDVEESPEEHESGPCVVCATITRRRAPGTPLFACGYHGGKRNGESDEERRRRLQQVYTEPRNREEPKP